MINKTFMIMKSIFLKDENGKFKKFFYTRRSELNAEFKKRNISINIRAKIGNDLFLGNNISIDRCKISDLVIIQDNSKIGYNAKLGLFCEIGYSVNVMEEAVIGENVSILSNCTIGIRSKINDNCIIYENSYIGNKVEILKDSIVNENSNITKELCLKNVCSRHKIFFYANSKLCIANNCFTLNEWINNCDELLKNYCFYYGDLILEYKKHIETVKNFQLGFDKYKNVAI